MCMPLVSDTVKLLCVLIVPAVPIVAFVRLAFAAATRIPVQCMSAVPGGGARHVDGTPHCDPFQQDLHCLEVACCASESNSHAESALNCCLAEHAPPRRQVGGIMCRGLLG